MLYKFRSLNEIAAHLETKAADIRAYLSSDKVNLRARHSYEEKARAGELESIASMLRNTLLEDKP